MTLGQAGKDRLHSSYYARNILIVIIVRICVKEINMQFCICANCSVVFCTVNLLCGTSYPLRLPRSAGECFFWLCAFLPTIGLLKIALFFCRLLSELPNIIFCPATSDTRVRMCLLTRFGSSRPILPPHQSQQPRSWLGWSSVAVHSRIRVLS